MDEEPIPQITITKNYLLNHSHITLTTICKNIQRHKQPISNTIVGIVTDCTKPLYRPKQKNYIVQVKLIDESLNDANIFGVMCKDCTVYLLSSKKKEIENLIRSIGDIVILDKFTFTLWNGIKLETKYLKMTEGLYTIDQSDPQNIAIKAGLSMNPELFDFNHHLKIRIQQLQQWRNREMYKYFQPKFGISIMNNHCAMVQPFNMLLKIGEELTETIERTSEQKKNRKFSRIMLTDGNGNKFGLVKPDSDDSQIQIAAYIIGNQEQNKSDPIFNIYHKLMEEEKDKQRNSFLVFIRGIKSINQNLEIELTETGNILKFNYHLPEPQNFMNYMAIHREGEKSLVENRNNLNLLQMKGLSSSQQGPLTIITENYNINNVTYLSDLIQLQDKYNHSNKKQEIPINETYLIKVIAIKHRGSLELYHREYQIIIDNKFFEELPVEEKRQCKDYRKIGYIYEGSLFVLDRSTESRGKLFEVKIFNCDEIGSFLLDHKCQRQFRVAEDAIDEKSKQEVERQKLSKIISQKMQSLCQKSDFQRMVHLVIEPIRSQKLLFRLVNTKIV